MVWKPLVEGELANAALAKARELSLDIAAHPGSPMDRTLFWAYASAVFDEPFASDALDTAIQDLVALLSRGGLHPMLYNDGLCGVGWALGHVVEGDSEELLVHIDEALANILSAETWRGPYDLSQGLAGYAVYLLERLKAGSKAARDHLARIVTLLETTATRTDDGVCWRTGPELLPPHIREKFPQGRTDYGLAHGLAGVVGVLSRLAAHDVPGAADLGTAATRCLVAQRQPPTEIGSRFRALEAPGIPYEPGRAAWCYGDLGVAFALWRGTPELARETALDCATRPAAHINVVDTALCHGSAGMTHLYNRLYQASGDDRFAACARNWLELTLMADRAKHLESGRGLVDGAAGAALAMIAAVSSTEPGWDRLMLMDLVG